MHARALCEPGVCAALQVGGADKATAIELPAAAVTCAAGFQELEVLGLAAALAPLNAALAEAAAAALGWPRGTLAAALCAAAAGFALYCVCLVRNMFSNLFGGFWQRILMQVLTVLHGMACSHTQDRSVGHEAHTALPALTLHCRAQVAQQLPPTARCGWRAGAAAGIALAAGLARLLALRPAALPALDAGGLSQGLTGAARWASEALTAQGLVRPAAQVHG